MGFFYLRRDLAALHLYTPLLTLSEATPLVLGEVVPRRTPAVFPSKPFPLSYPSSWRLLCRPTRKQVYPFPSSCHRFIPYESPVALEDTLSATYPSSSSVH